MGILAGLAALALLAIWLLVRWLAGALLWHLFTQALTRRRRARRERERQVE